MESVLNSIKSVIKNDFLSYLWENNDMSQMSLKEAQVVFDTWCGNGPTKKKTGTKSTKLSKPEVKSLQVDLSDDDSPKRIPVLAGTVNNFSTMKLKELRAECKERNLKVTGTAESLKLSLMEYEQAKEQGCNFQNLKSTLIKKPAACLKKKAPTVVEEKVTKIEIYQDEYGNMIHEETGLVFDKETDRVIGYVTDKHGHVKPLTGKHIDLCKSMQLSYEIPDNLELDDDE